MHGCLSPEENAKLIAELREHWCEDETSIPDTMQVVYYHYEIEGYEGHAFCLFLQDDVLYEVSGSHCSCNGLEEQWQPEQASIKELLHRYRSQLEHDRYAETANKVLEALAWLQSAYPQFAQPSGNESGVQRSATHIAPDQQVNAVQPSGSDAVVGKAVWANREVVEKYTAFCTFWQQQHNEEVDEWFLFWWDGERIQGAVPATLVMALMEVAYRAWCASRLYDQEQGGV